MSPRHMIVLLLWVAVFGAVAGMSWLIDEVRPETGTLGRSFAITIVLVPALSYAITPWISRRVHDWHGKRRDG